MERRQVLGGLVGGVAATLGGCFTGEAGTIDEPLADEVDPGTPAEGYPALSVEGDEIPSDHESELEAVVGVVSHHTATEPARIRIDLVNRGRESRNVTFGASPPFSRYRAEHEFRDAVVWIAPEDRSHTGVHHVRDEWSAAEDPRAPVGGCWRAKSVRADGIAKTQTIAAGEMLSGSYAVLADADVDGCLPAGEYRFDHGWSVETESDGSVGLDWGFTLAVESPDD